MNLQSRIEGGESDLLEFKSVPDIATTLQAVAAMLNTAGGTVVVGVDDHGEILGVSDAAGEARALGSALRERLSPSAPISVGTEDIKGKSVIVIDVPVGRDRPYVVDGRIHVRRGTQVIVAQPHDIGRMIMPPSEPLWERQPCLGASVEDLDHEQVKRVLQGAASSGRWSGTEVRAFLDRLGMVKNGQPTNGAVVLFGKSPATYLPQTRVRCAAWGKGAEMADNRLLDGHIFQLQAAAIAFLTSHLPISSSIPTDSVYRVDAPAIPLLALREAVLNALAHRDYGSYSGSVQIGVHADRVEVWNAGGLPEGVRVEDLPRSHASRPRNPGIAHVLYLAGLVEGFGVGTTRIADSYRGRTEHPTWTLDTGGVRLTLPLSGSPKASRITLNERQLTMLRAWPPGHEFGSQDYQDAFGHGVSSRTVRNDLSSLVDAGFLEQLGSGKTTTYRRTDKSKD